MTLQLNLPPEIETKLRERAAAAGKDVSTFVEEVVAQQVAGAVPTISGPPKLSPAEQWDRLREWMEEMSAWTAKNLPRGHFVDDSRESIYAGRGEGAG